MFPSITASITNLDAIQIPVVWRGFLVGLEPMAAYFLIMHWGGNSKYT